MSSFPRDMSGLWWSVVRGASPVIAISLHSGGAMRRSLRKKLQLGLRERQREEDPYTDYLAGVASNQLIAHRSRFEADLNRPRESAIYQSSEEAWGLPLWKEPLTEAERKASLLYYDSFYLEAARLLSEIEEQYGQFVLLDLHTYNHRREGRGAPPANPEENPEVNIGTGSVPDSRWEPLIRRFMEALRAFDFRGRHLDVRENVKFRGGHFSRWVHANHPDTGLALAVEFKKFFMNEWTGEVDMAQLECLRMALVSSLPVLLREIKGVKGG